MSSRNLGPGTGDPGPEEPRLGTPDAPTPNPGPGPPAPGPRNFSVGERIQQHVDADGIAIGRELIEEARVLSLTFPRVRYIGVVRHEHHEPSAAVADSAGVHAI